MVPWSTCEHNVLLLPKLLLILHMLSVHSLYTLVFVIESDCQGLLHRLQLSNFSIADMPAADPQQISSESSAVLKKKASDWGSTQSQDRVYVVQKGRTKLSRILQSSMRIKWVPNSRTVPKDQDMFVPHTAQLQAYLQSLHRRLYTVKSHVGILLDAR